MRNVGIGIGFVVLDAPTLELQRMARLHGRAKEEINEGGDVDITDMLIRVEIGDGDPESHAVDRW